MNWWDFIDSFYERRDGQEIKPGDIVWCPAVCWEMKRKILNISRASTDTKTHDIVNASIEDFSPDTHYKDNNPNRTLPIYKLGLRRFEELVLDKTKVRPCVVLHCEREKVPLNGENDKGTILLNQDVLTLLPVYGLEDNGHNVKYNPKTIHRIKWLRYKKLFFFPADNEHAIKKDSFARLDMMFQIPIRHICGPSFTKLHKNCFSLLKLYVLNHFQLGFSEEEYKAELELISLAHESFVDL